MLGRRVVGGLALCAALLMPAGAVMAQADTEVAGSFDSEAGGSLDASSSADDGGDEYVPWFIGPYWRHVWFPSYTGDVFLDRAPSISNNGFGLLFTYRDEGGFSLVIGAGYTPYEFEGAFLGPGKPDEDTEWVTSDLALWHITGSVLWPINFHEMLTLEIGIGLDLGLLAGDIIRTEAVRESLPDGRFVPCTGPLNPNTVGNDARVPFCDTPAELDPGTEGEHYGVREDRVPPVFGMPFLPQLALRFAPHRYIAVKAEFGFSVVQMFAGAGTTFR